MKLAYLFITLLVGLSAPVFGDEEKPKMYAGVLSNPIEGTILRKNVTYTGPVGGKANRFQCSIGYSKDQAITGNANKGKWVTIIKLPWENEDIYDVSVKDGELVIKNKKAGKLVASLYLNRIPDSLLTE